MLWGRPGNRCAICRLDLILDPTETYGESLIGEECHIVAEKKDGPIGQADLDEAKRDKYDNIFGFAGVIIVKSMTLFFIFQNHMETSTVYCDLP